MSYDYHQSWSRDGGPRGSGQGSGAGGGGSRGSGGGGGGRGGRGRHPAHLKGREIGLWYAKKQTQKNKEAERQERAVVHMDERREEQIVQLLNSVQAKNDKDSEAQISWFAPEDHGYGTEVSSEKKINSEKKLDNQEKKLLNQEKKTYRITDKSYIDRDSEYLLQQNEPNLGLDQQLLEDLQKKKTDPRYIEMQRFRKKLPSYGMQKELVNLINNHQVTVISGETGCGKTTQVTQFILDNYIERGIGSACRIVCTQPRRISAISVAERVAAERAESCGNGNSTGYQIRLQSRLPRKQGSILYCTTGIILQWLQSDS